MDRSGCSRWTDLSVHDGPKRAAATSMVNEDTQGGPGIPVEEHGPPSLTSYDLRGGMNLGTVEGRVESRVR